MVEQVRVALGARILAVFLVLGGIIGVGLALLMAYPFVQAHWVYLLLIAAFAAVFVWSALTGVRLWQGQARGWKWATILFAAQVPVFSVPGLSYEYYTGFAIKLMGGAVESSFSLGLGSSANFYLDTRITEVFYGINLFAVAAVIYLLLRRSRTAGPASPQNA